MSAASDAWMLDAPPSLKRCARFRGQQLAAALQNRGAKDRPLRERQALPDCLEHRVLLRQQPAERRVQIVERRLSSAAARTSSHVSWARRCTS